MRLFECSQKDPCTWRRHQRYEFATKSRLRLETDVALRTSKPGILDAMSHRCLGRMGCEALDFWIVEQNSQTGNRFLAMHSTSCRTANHAFPGVITYIACASFRHTMQIKPRQTADPQLFWQR